MSTARRSGVEEAVEELRRLLRDLAKTSEELQERLAETLRELERASEALRSLAEERRGAAATPTPRPLSELRR